MADMHEVELNDIRLQADQITNESLESTRRMVQLAEETQETGVRTLVALDEQGDQLNKIEQNLDQINADMREAEKNLTGLEKFCGLCTCWKRGGGRKGRSDAYKKKGYDNATTGDGEGRGKDRSGFSGDVVVGGGGGGGYVNRVTGDDREDEMDENLGQVAGIVGNLKSMALEMGNELDAQNTVLTRVNEKAGDNKVRVESANKRAENILKK